MKLLIVAAIAALAFASCNTHENSRIESGNEHVKDAAADYTEASKSAVTRALDTVSDSADEAAHALRK